MILNGEEIIYPNTIVWKITSISIPSGLSREEVLCELRAALKVYGCSGMTEDEQELWRRKFNQQNPNGFAITDF